MSGVLNPTYPCTRPGPFDPYNGAGLLIWAGSSHFVRMERAAILGGNGLVSYVAFEVHDETGPVSFASMYTSDGPYYLRFERRGDVVFASVSSDGESWTLLDAAEVKLPEHVDVGVAAIRTAHSPPVTQ